MTKSIRQRINLVGLAGEIATRKEPLGVGLKNQCWAGVAITRAKRKNDLATEHYGLTMKQIKLDICGNNQTAPEVRNRTMLKKTLKHALT